MAKFILSCILLVPCMYAQAQDTTATDKKLKITGSADAYYQYNTNENADNNITSFTNSHNSFELGMFSVQAAQDLGKVSLYADVGFGKRADQFDYNDELSSIALKQLYVSYAPADWVKFTLGSFATYVGYELVDPTANRNYSMSYMFSFGPFFHTGLKADFTAGDHHIMVGVFNPNDYKYAPPNSNKYLGAQYAYLPDGPFNMYLNYIEGKDLTDIRNNQVDAVLTLKAGENTSFDYDGTVSYYNMNGSNAKWCGSAIYINQDFSEGFGMTLRAEYFSDPDGLKVFTDPTAFPSGGNIWSFTLSGDWRVGPLTIIPELRLDHASHEVFSKYGMSKSNNGNLLLAAVYSFGN